MSSDINRMNQHIFSEGNIQLSPVEIQMLNKQLPIVFKARYINSIIDSGYKVMLTGYADKILKKELESKYAQVIETGINSLRSNPRPTSGYSKKGSIDTRTLDIGFFYIWYKIFSGQVLVYNIEPKNTVQLERDRLEKSGLYKIKKNTQGVWESKGKIDTITTTHAAVNGQSNNLVKASWLMGAHIEFEFGKGTLNEFTLFHNPSAGGLGDTWESLRDKFGTTTDIAKQFSALLQKTQKTGNKTKWLAHSQGGLIFAEAVRYHLNGNSSWAVTGGFNGVFRDDKGESLNAHSVAFHGNANNNIRSNILFKRAGVEVIATKANDYDLVNTIVGLNTANPWRVIGSIVYSNHVMNGSVQQSPHTLMHDGFNAWDNLMENGAGKGRNTMQKGFDTIDKAGRGSIRYINNFLK